MLTGLAFGAGWLPSRLADADRIDRFTIALSFLRNVGIATGIAVTVFGQTEFAVFGTAYFLVQVPILLAAVLPFRYIEGSRSTTVAGACRP